MKSRILFYLILITFLATLIPAVHAQTFSVIYTFTGHTDGAYPWAGVTIRGNALYGTAGSYWSSAYQLTHLGANWTLSTLASLSPNNDTPLRVVFGPDGHLYGTSALGGTNEWGTVFKLTPQAGPCQDAACYWTVNVLHEFSPGNGDGLDPMNGDLFWDQQGHIYGTTSSGGTFLNGTVYQLTPSGNGYTESVLYSLSGGVDGSTPYAGLVFDNKGNLFGTTEIGGGTGCYLHMGCGTIFELTYVPGVGWTEHLLYSFQDSSDGSIPGGGLIFDSAGNLYGTTTNGGNGGGGTVFELSPSGDTWTYKLLYSFSGNGYGPEAALSMDGAGNLYGTTGGGGIYQKGNVFKLSNTQNGWVYTSLYDFTGGSDGNGSTSYVSIDTDGTLYGVATFGGDLKCNAPDGCGVVWMIKP